ncbi:MAG TPA: rhodanese-like domain-containing protein [Saprospiraceae bacterium]|nr:rhodanese-like domain-containing protein [Saprospiraceae bacterium]
MKIFWAFLFLPLFSCSQVHPDPRISNPEYAGMLQKLLKHDVPEISCDSLFRNFSNFTLLDTRTAEEYQTSHLKAALFVDYDEFRLENLPLIPKDRPVVCYCSVGYRSEKITAVLRKAGYKQVYNLYGSIFEWANRGYPVFDSSGMQTRKVHGYNARWSRWIANPDFQVLY